MKNIYKTKQQLIDLGVSWVANDGENIEFNGRIYKAYDSQTGYKMFCLYPRKGDLNLNSFKIKAHRAVALWYIGDIPDDYQVDHIDHDGWNNNVSNLRIVPTKVNLANKNKRGLRIRKPTESIQLKNKQATKNWRQNNPQYQKEWRKAHPDYQKNWRAAQKLKNS